MTPIERPIFGGEPADLSDAAQVELGRFTFAVRWRVSGASQGLTIHVFGPAVGVGPYVEMLRFDAFDDPAHYHLGWSYRDEPFIRIDDPDPFAWSIRALVNDLDGLLVRAGACPTDDAERAGLRAAAARLEELGRALAAGR